MAKRIVNVSPILPSGEQGNSKWAIMSDEEPAVDKTLAPEPQPTERCKCGHQYWEHKGGSLRACNGMAPIEIGEHSLKCNCGEYRQKFGDDMEDGKMQHGARFMALVDESEKRLLTQTLETNVKVLEKAEVDISEQRDQIIGLRDELKSMTEDRDDMKQRLIASNKSASDMQVQIGEQQNLLIDYRDKLKIMTEDRDEYRQKFVDAEQRLHTCKAVANEAREKNRSLGGLLDKTAEERNDYREQFRDASRIVEDFRVMNLELGHRIDKAEQERNEYKKLLCRATRERSEYRSEVMQVEKRLDVLLEEKGVREGRIIDASYSVGERSRDSVSKPITPLVYMAHPVRPLDGSDETVASNLRSAKRWLKALSERHPHLCFIAPWITGCELWDDADEELRRIGLAHCHVVIRRCDRLWMVGPRVSSGMRGEADVALGCGKLVADFTGWEMVT